jgi:HPt (histidine-containing phosphotransfer) domain-containing protein
MDAAAFSEMKELMGDTFYDVINLCLQSLPQQLQDIEDAIAKKDAASLFNLSHKMKSACGSIGAFGLAEKAEQIEIIGRNGSVDVSEQILNDFRAAIGQVVSILNAELSD